MESQFVPEVSSPDDVYPAIAREFQTRRWEHLLAKFQEIYSCKADFISRSPGRVNIIGEHIDYSLYEVLPMAVTADIILAVKISKSPDPTIRLANVHDTKFPARKFQVPVSGDIEIDARSLEWSNYFKSGLRGAIELLRKKGLLSGSAPVSMDILVDGTVPTGGGLSSSAAFVCASALATLIGNGVEKVDKEELVSLAVVSERHVGVNSGGMDQTASVFGLQGSALHVGFAPLNAQPLSFPKSDPEMTFVIANTLVQADKHTTGPVNYNLRVVETTLAAQVLAKYHNLSIVSDSSPLESSLRGFQNALFNRKELSDEEKLKGCIEAVKEGLVNEEGYTREEIAKILDTSMDKLNQKYMTRFPVRAERFQLRNRALHVYSEALRVNEAVALFTSTTDASAFYKRFGELMIESQDSCRDLYNCSCPELEELCSLARKAGSYGSRLTGAGWGGCSVHLMPQDKVEEIKGTWLTEYYNRKFPDLTEEELAEVIVVSKPGSGSVLFRVTEKAEEDKGLHT